MKKFFFILLLVFGDLGLYALYSSHRHITTEVEYYVDNHRVDSTIVAEICYGYNYTENGFNLIAPDIGIHYDTLYLHDIHGDDSIVALTLTVQRNYKENHTAEICFGESYTDSVFNLVTPSVGIHNEMLVLQTIHGCDSIVTLTLIVNPVYKKNYNAKICYGKNYTSHGFHIIAPSVGVHYDTLFLNTVNGCDSIVTLKLTVNPVYEEYHTAEICSGEDYNEYGFNLIAPSPGVHNETQNLQTICNCDSIITLDLTVNPIYDTVLIKEICSGDDYTDNGFNLIAPSVGVHNETHFLHTIHDCDSVVSLNLTVKDKPNLEIHGLTQIAISTDLWPGIYSYCLADSANIQQCDITWSCSEPTWILQPSDDKYWCTLIAPTLGTATLTASADCELYCDTYYSIEINASYLGIDETGDNPMSVYPNPASNQLVIKGVQLKQVVIYDCYGQKFNEINIDSEDEITIDTGNLSNGLYVAYIVTAKGKATKRFIVLK